jgi:protein CpxP
VNKQLTFWKITVIILVVLNISMIVTFEYRTEWHGKQNDAERPDAFIIRKLHFTDAQTAVYVRLRNNHHDSMITLNAQGRELRKVFFNKLETQDVPQQTDSIANLVAANQREIEKVTYYHFVQVRALCTDSQKTVFDGIISDVMEKMGRPMHGEQSGGKHGEGPPPPPKD